MIEFKSLQNRFFIHQALMAAANAALNNGSPGSNNSSHSPQEQQNRDQESLEINTSSSSVYTTVSSVSSSPILQHSPQANRTGPLKRKLNETDIPDVTDPYTNSGKRSTIQQQQQKSPASFLISDILGLDSGRQSNPIAKSASHQYELNLYQQYQASLQQQYYAVLTNYLMANSAKLNHQQSSNKLPIPSQHQYNTNSSSKHQPKLEVSPIPRIDPTTPSSNSDSGHKKCASGILSSLEQLTKKQFQDDFEIANCLSEAKRSHPTVSGPTQLPAKSKSHRGMDENEHSSNGKQNNSGMNSDSGNSSGESKKAPTVVGVDKSELPAWVFCTRYSDRPSAGPRHRKKTKTTNSSVGNTSSASNISSGCTNNAVAKKTALLSNTVVKSANSSFSFSPSHQFHSQAAKKQQSKPTKVQIFEHDTENESKIFGDDYGDEELCYDSDDSNMSGSKRPRTAFTGSQLHRLKVEFENCKYLTGEKRQYLANELNLNESQIKIWFQNKRAKIKKSSGTRNNGLAAQLMAQGLYNHGSNKDE